MIAEIRGYRGKPEYVALRWDGARWIPVRGDRGRHGEGSREDAIALCVRHLQRCMVGTAGQAKVLHALCDRRGRPRTEREDRRMRELASCLARTLESAEIDLAMLLEAPSANDSVAIEATYTASERQTADSVFLGQVIAPSDYELASCLVRTLESAMSDLLMLLEVPSVDDPGERQTTDRVFLGQVIAALNHANITTGQRVSDQGIADAIALLERLRADRNRPSNGNGHDNGGDEA